MDAGGMNWSKKVQVDSTRYMEMCLEKYAERVQELSEDKSLSEEYRHYLKLEARLECLNRALMIRANMADVYGYGMMDERLPKQTPELLSLLNTLDWNTSDFFLMNTEGMGKMCLFFKEEGVLEKTFGTGYLSDLSKAKVCENRLVRKLPLEEEQMEAMRFATPGTVQLFELVYAGEEEAWEQHLAKPGYRECEIPDAENEALFDALLKPYRGRVVLVDFWGTACVPCVRAMKTIKPLKKELADEPISYVYITSESAAPLETWQQMIPDIGGDHYRLTREQYKCLTEYFKISGVPYYVLVNRKGEIVFRSTGFMGVDKTRELLKKALAE